MRAKICEIINPKSIAVVGASNMPRKWGYEVFYNLKETGYTGKLYPVNPRENEIQGVKAYKSLSDIPDPVDMISVCVPAVHVPEIIKEAEFKGVKSAVIFTNGFKESGNFKIESELQAAFQDSNIRIFGPNIQGIINTGSNILNIFNMTMPKKGNVGVVSQSGSVSAYISEKLSAEGAGISALINLGNQFDINETDVIEYLLDDNETHVIALYLEGPTNKAGFKALMQCRALEKPIVLLKPGRTSVGETVAISHTGNIAGNDTVFSAACQQYGLIRAANITSFADTIVLLANCNPITKRKVVIFSSSGGVAGISADELVSRGFELAVFPKEIVADVTSAVGSLSNIGGVMDLAENIENWVKVAEILEKKYQDCFDNYFFMVADGLEKIEDSIIAINRITQKPIVVSYMSEGHLKTATLAALHDSKISVFETPDRAAEAMQKSLWFNTLKERRNVNLRK